MFNLNSDMICDSYIITLVILKRKKAIAKEEPEEITEETSDS